MTIFYQLATNLSVIIPSCLSTATQIQASIKRISKVIKAKEHSGNLTKISKIGEEGPFISINNVTVKIGKDVVLRNVSFEVNKPGLYVITGAVGSGKSSLVRLLLGDLHPCEGKQTDIYM